jgi:hypothetical protein
LASNKDWHGFVTTNSSKLTIFLIPMSDIGTFVPCVLVFDLSLAYDFFILINFEISLAGK